MSSNRNKVIAYLAFLSGDTRIPERLLSDLPKVRAQVFSAIWFDEIYIPAERYFDCLKGDLDHSAAKEFFEEFSREERDALEQFHHFFELRVQIMVDRGEGQQFSEESDCWLHITKDARFALSAFDTSPLPPEEILRELASGWFATSVKLPLIEANYSK